MSALTISFPPPDDYLCLNDRSHWAKRARITAAWREVAAWEAMRAVPTSARPLPRCDIAFVFPFGRSRRRDPHNYVATVKPIVDGLVDAGLWPDDTTGYVRTLEPTLAVQPGGLVVITITPTGDPT